MSFPGKVLLVDDEAHVRKFVGLILRQLGATTLLEAGNGRDALEIYQRDKPDLVLLDVNMPVLDGLQTLRELLQIDPDCIAVMLTSLANRQTVEEAVQRYSQGRDRRSPAPDDRGMLHG
jgi:two-component system, chemotaxis family, chemotaxis protein CheY